MAKNEYIPDTASVRNAWAFWIKQSLEGAGLSTADNHAETIEKLYVLFDRWLDWRDETNYEPGEFQSHLKFRGDLIETLASDLETFGANMSLSILEPDGELKVRAAQETIATCIRIIKERRF
jgi:hypothetical protein